MTGQNILCLCSVIGTVVLATVAGACAGGAGKLRPPSHVMTASPPPPAVLRSNRQSLADTEAELEQAVAPPGVDPTLWESLKSALSEELAARYGRSLAIRAPSGIAGAVDDLKLTEDGEGSWQLSWTYRNPGDFNQDGVVNIQDISPLAVHFDQNVSEEPSAVVADGNEDGIVNIADLTVLAANFGGAVSWYEVQRSDLPSGPFTTIAYAPLGVAQSAITGRAFFSLPVDEVTNSFYRVVPDDGIGHLGEFSNVACIPVRITSVSPTVYLSNRQVTFTAEVTGTPPLEFNWDFGGAADPNTSMDEMPSVIVGERGEYNATLAVGNGVTTAVFPFTLELYTGEDTPAIASFGLLEGIPGASMQVSAVVTGALPMTYHWDFGAGASPTSSNEESPTLTLGEEGAYSGWLRVTNDFGTARKNFLLTVISPSWYPTVIDNEPIDPDWDYMPRACFPAAAIINGRPAVAYDVNKGQGSHVFRFAISSTPDGTGEWLAYNVMDSPPSYDSLRSRYLDLAEIRGRPTISFVSDDGVKLLLSPTSDGSGQWQEVTAAIGNVSGPGALAEVDGRHAVAYWRYVGGEEPYDVEYAVSDQADGLGEWSVQTVSSSPSDYAGIAMRVINGRPVVAYSPSPGWYIAVAFSSSADGLGPWVLEVTPGIGGLSSLSAVDGRLVLLGRNIAVETAPGPGAIWQTVDTSLYGYSYAETAWLIGGHAATLFYDFESTSTSGTVHYAWSSAADGSGNWNSELVGPGGPVALLDADTRPGAIYVDEGGTLRYAVRAE